MLYILETALRLGLFYAPIPLALFLSYRILNIADLTTDGSFVLGMAVSVSIAALGHPFLGMLLGMAAGALAGSVTALLQTRGGVPSILAGIITNTGLYTVNLAVMGFSSNKSLLKQETVFSLLKKLIPGEHYEILIGLFLIALLCLFLRFFLSTRLGLSLRATGDNIAMIRSSSVDPDRMILIGLCISNSFTALAGALVAQMQRSADINAGSGIVTVGLACLIIGETLLGKRSLTRNILAAVTGSLFYRLLYALILKTRVVPVECLRLLTAVIVAAAIVIPYLQEQAAVRRRREC
ncbi:MAG: ABC transporter permease [Erysipelotrichaceae bacterium]|nr:ABC transporter permease [Erysipelotrichaceae bacterium]